MSRLRVAGAGALAPIACAFAALLVAVGPAAAHASPEPLDNEIHLIADEATDLFAVHDGFDIQDLFVREGYHKPAGEAGLIMRVVIYGGPSPVPGVAAEQRIELDAGGQTITLASSDGFDWGGDATVLEASLESEGDGAIAGALQVFVPRSRLGVTDGDAVTGFAVRSYAGDALVDDAPGSYYVAGQAAPDGGSTILADTITLAGPLGYTATEVVRDGQAITLTVQNQITVIGQNITIAHAGDWVLDVADAAGQVAEPGTHPTFAIRVTTQGDADLILHVDSDLGGRETLRLAPDADAAAPVLIDDVPTDGGLADDAGAGPGEDASDGAAGEDTPAPTFVAVALLVVAVAAVSRRR